MQEVRRENKFPVIHLCLFIPIPQPIHIYLFEYVFMHACMPACVQTCTCICACLCVYISWTHVVVRGQHVGQAGVSFPSVSFGVRTQACRFGVKPLPAAPPHQPPEMFFSKKRRPCFLTGILKTSHRCHSWFRDSGESSCYWFETVCFPSNHLSLGVVTHWQGHKEKHTTLPNELILEQARPVAPGDSKCRKITQGSTEEETR